MRANIEARKRKHRRQAVLGFSVLALLQLFCTGLFASLCFIPYLPQFFVVLFAVLAVLCLVPLGFGLVVLRQRFQEIKGGELDAAAEY